MVKKYYIPCGIWIGSYKDDSSKSEILMKYVLGKKYNIKLNDWDMDCIEKVEIEFSKLSKVIVYQ